MRVEQAKTIKPKRKPAYSPYIAFYLTERKNIQESKPHLSGNNLQKEVGRIWRNMSE